MPQKLEPNQTPRAEAYALWAKAPMPMVTLFQTLDVTRLLRRHRRSGEKFHALMCWCIGSAAQASADFYLLPVEGGIMQYEQLAISTVVVTENGSISTCDVPFCEDLSQFHHSYLDLTAQVRRSGVMHDLSQTHMVIGTSALPGYPIDGVVNLYAGCFNNPFLLWGGWRRKGLRDCLPVSFQFHHSQMDGVPAAQFLQRLQAQINALPRR